MKVLIVCSGNFPDPEKNFSIYQPFINDQIKALKNHTCELKLFLIEGKGFLGYLKNYFLLINKIKSFKPDLIHAHYGFSGMLAVLQRKIPAIITFHGSDINEKGKNLIISKIAERMASFSIFVSTKLASRLKPHNSFDVISCGVDLEENIYLDKKESRLKLGFDLEKKLILFSSNFNTIVKNYPLAKRAIGLIKQDIELIEMKGYSRQEVTLLMNACDALLVTSNNESGPLVVKEAMACGCPIISTDVGDVKEIIGETKGCFITSFDPNDIASKIIATLNFNKRTEGREKIKHFDMNLTADKIFEVYNHVYTQYYQN